MAFTDLDKDLLRRCLAKQPGSWNDFVDRFLGLIYHAIHFTAHLRSARISPEDVEDIAAEVLVQIVADDFKPLRLFQKKSSLSTYLTVIARRICVHELTRRQTVREAIQTGQARLVQVAADESEAAQRGMEKLDEVDALLRKLAGKEREIVRQFYFENRTYEEISTELNVPVNSVGSVLSRARTKLREVSKSTGGLKPVKPAKSPAAKAPKPAKKKP